MDPAEFIPVAEAAGMVGTLGDHVLRTALREYPATGWTEGLMLSVNISRHDLVDEEAAVSAGGGGLCQGCLYGMPGSLESFEHTVVCGTGEDIR